MRSLVFISLLTLGVITAGTVRAEEAIVDPPGRVARLSYTEGEVSLAPAGTEEWAEAVLNRPLTTGDRVWVDNGGRAELQIGSATVHLDGNTGLSIVDLDDDVIHLDVTEGSANVRVLRKRDDESIEVSTPNSTVAILRPGEYRIEANDAGDQTIVRTRNGEAEVSGGSKTWRVDTSEEGVFDGVDEIAARVEPLGPRTAFEDWANDRNRVSENAVSTRYVSNEVVGYEDLDRHGYWVNEPSYGYVWQPSYVVAGWAPYRHGRWVWVSPWGWSWVDNSPWGFAPFHYGRWAYVRSRWCWVPGPRHIRPVYAPALVAWTSSPGISVSVGFGSGVGWFPLGPREIYVPGYRYSRRYFSNVNVSNTVIVNNTYINNFYDGRRPRNFDYRYGRDARAVTIVDRDRFVGGRPIDGHWSRVADLRRWHHDSRPPAIAPNRDSVFAARTLGRIPGRPRDAAQVSVARTQRDDRPDFNPRSNLNRRIPFDAEQRAIEANGGRPIGRAQLLAANPAGAASSTSSRNEARNDNDRNDRDRSDNDRERAARSSAGIHPRLDRNETNGAELRRSLSDRPSWVQERLRDRQRPATGSAPPVNSLQSSGSAAPTERRDRSSIDRPGPQRDRVQQSEAEAFRPQNRVERQIDPRDVSSAPHVRQREQGALPSQPQMNRDREASRPQLRPEQPRMQPQPRVERRVEQQPRVQPQPRVEQPRVPPQARPEQPRVQPRPQPQVEQPRFQTSQPRSEPPRSQPRYEAPRSQPQAQPRTERSSSSVRAARPQSDGGHQGESRRFQSGNGGNRPHSRQQ